MTEEKTVTEELQELQDWIKALDKRDAAGFAQLMKLPNTMDVIRCLPKGEYKDMAIKAFAVKRYLISKGQLPKEGKK